MGVESAVGTGKSKRKFTRHSKMERRKIMPFSNFSAEYVRDFIPMIAVAVFGAGLQSFHGKWRGWKNFFLSLATAGFGACLVGVLFRGMGISTDIAFFLSGMIGYSGGSLVDNLLDMTTHRLTNEYADSHSDSYGDFHGEHHMPHHAEHHHEDFPREDFPREDFPREDTHYEGKDNQ